MTLNHWLVLVNLWIYRGRVPSCVEGDTAQVSHVFCGLLGRALCHDKLNAVDLRAVIGKFFDYFALFEVPNDKCAIFGPGSHVTIALRNGNVDNHILMPV